MLVHFKKATITAFLLCNHPFILLNDFFTQNAYFIQLYSAPLDSNAVVLYCWCQGQMCIAPSRRWLGKGRAFSSLSSRAAPLLVRALHCCGLPRGSLTLTAAWICHSTSWCLVGRCCFHLPCYPPWLLVCHPSRTSLSSLCSDSWRDYPWKYGFLTGCRLGTEILPGCEFSTILSHRKEM